jgi:hypothetical protein
VPRVLVCVPHFFRRASDDTKLSNGSNMDTPAERGAQFSYCLRQILAILEPSQFLMGSPGRIALEQVSLLPKATQGDLVVVTAPGENLLDAVSYGNFIEHVYSDGPPRELGYHCRRIFADNVDEYDLYCFIEDDTAILDSFFFQKVAAFYEAFGEDKVILPNRYEIMGVRDGAWRAYLDIPAFPNHRTGDVPGADQLEAPGFGGPVRFTKTRDAMSGCYVITAGQLRDWLKQPDFDAPLKTWLSTGRDPMELTQVPMGGLRPIYRPAPENIGFLEVHHVPNRLSKTPGPYPQVLAHLAPLADERRRRRELRGTERSPPLS